MPPTFSPLVTCPNDILDQIVELLDGPDIIKLFSTNNLDLKRRLGAHGSVKRFCALVPSRPPARGDPVPWKLPSIVAQLPKLTTLALICQDRTPRTFMVGALLCLPATLTDLHFRFDQAMSWWLQPAQQMGNNDEGLAYPDCLVKPIFLDRLLPNLRRLKLRGTTCENLTMTSLSPIAVLEETYMDNSIVPYIPNSEAFKEAMTKNFQHGSSTVSWKGSMWLQWLAHLPPTLTSLSLCPLRFSHQPDTMIPSPILLLPTSLEKLKLLGNYHDRTRMSDYARFPNLTNLGLLLSNSHSSPFWDGPFPTQLVKLNILDGPNRFPDQMPSWLPPNLKSLKTLNYLPWPFDLPSTVTTLVLGNVSTSVLSNLPSTVTSLYANLTSQQINFELLPKNLLRLELVSDFGIFDSDIGRLPRSLTYLHLEGSRSSLRDPAMLLLPQNLRHLALGDCSYLLTSACFVGLPKSLTYLSLDAHGLKDDISDNMPPCLRTLWLKNATLTDQILNHLPKTLESIRFRIHMTGALLQGHPYTTIDHSMIRSCVLNCLPTPEARKDFLKWDGLDLYALQTVRPIHDSLRTLPPSVTSITYPNLVSGAFLGNQLANLTYLNLPKDVRTGPIEISLLKSLTYLSMPINPMFGSSHWYPLPPNLRHLDLSASDWLIMPTLEKMSACAFPGTLTSLSAGIIHSDVIEYLMVPLTNLTTFKFSSEKGDNTDWFAMMPRSLTALDWSQVDSEVSSDEVSSLPNSLTSLIMSKSTLSNISFNSMPQSLEELKVKSLIFYPPAVVNAIESGSMTPVLPATAFSEFTSPHTMAIIPSLDGGDKILKKVSADDFEVRMDDAALAQFLSPTLLSLTLSVNHEALSDNFIALLPRTITYLDVVAQQTGLTTACLGALPPALLSFFAFGQEFIGPDVFSLLPRSITDLDLLKTPGRLSTEKAAQLPPGLKRLRLGQTRATNEGFAALPRTLTCLELTVCPDVTDACVPHLPPGLTRLTLPTAKITTKSFTGLPLTLAFFKLGAAFNIPLPQAVKTLQHLLHATPSAK